MKRRRVRLQIPSRVSVTHKEGGETSKTSKMAAPTNLVQLYHSEGVPDKLKGKHRVKLLKEIEGTFALTQGTLLLV